MSPLLLYFALGTIFGAALVTIGYIHVLKKQRQAALELENQLRSHSFELQITLDELAEKNQLLEQQSQRDTLSGTYNRAYFDRQMRSEIKRSRREQRPLALVLLDIDHFKQVNDNYGHLAGDQVIRQVCNLIQTQLKRPGDKLCRYGGEEFALILPNTHIEGANQLAEQIRQQLELNSLRLTELASPLQLTLSAGCYANVPGTECDNDEFIRFADSALYRAKQNGRNQVQCYLYPASANAPTVSGDVNEH